MSRAKRAAKAAAVRRALTPTIDDAGGGMGTAIRVSDITYAVSDSDLPLVAGSIAIRLINEQPEGVGAIFGAMWFRLSRTSEPERTALLNAIVAGIRGERCHDRAKCTIHGPEGVRGMTALVAELAQEVAKQAPRGDT